MSLNKGWWLLHDMSSLIHTLIASHLDLHQLGPKKYQNIARMYDPTGLSTKCTLIKTGFKNLRTGTKANFRPFVDALVFRQICFLLFVLHLRTSSK